MLCFALGYFQRGKAKAPHQVNPPKIITTKELKLQIKLALSHTDIIKRTHGPPSFKDFIFDNPNKIRTTRFMQIHTTRHLKIIQDILK